LAATGEQPTATPCVFCEATDRKVTKEHVWPRWLRKFIELGEGPPIGHSRIHATSKGETLSHKPWSAIPIDLQVKAPCKPCNEGWMEDLEAEVRPVLIPMLEDKAVVLDAIQQHTLAKWATLRAMMAQHAHPPGKQAIPAATYHRFYRTRTLPVGAQVWTGRYGGAGGWPTDYHHVELFHSGPGRPEPASPNGYVAAFSVGYAAFLYWGHEIEDGPVLDIGGDLSRYFVPVWPPTAPVDWPPPGVLGANGLEASIRGLPIEF
jgi:hypothetical protein